MVIKLTENDLLLNDNDHPKTKDICYTLCHLDNCDPEKETTGLNNTVPSGLKYQLWQYRIHKVRRIFEVINGK